MPGCTRRRHSGINDALIYSRSGGQFVLITENSMVGLTEYTSNDFADMYLCWTDIDTQKGYNGTFNQTFEEFERFQLKQFELQFKFWVTIIDKQTSQKVGVQRLGLDEICPDLAIWIYPQHRNKGYGTQSFKIALEYIFENYPNMEISAGCYEIIPMRNCTRIWELLVVRSATKLIAVGF